MALMVFENDYFALVKVSGVGINNTPWEELEVVSKGIARKHVVEVKLNRSTYGNQYNGTPIVHQYTDAYVAHGNRMSVDTLQETEEYIQALQEAVKFAKKVNKWLFKHDYHA